MIDRLAVLFEAKGCAPDTAAEVAGLVARLDPAKLLDAFQNGDAAFRIFDVWDLLKLPPQEWLFKGMIPKGALVGLIAPPERYKTFPALDMHLSVSTTGGRWLGRYSTAQAPSVYVSAEGSGGLLKRVSAWAEYHDTQPAGHFVTEAVALMDDAVTATFIHELGQVVENPSLVIFDTLARCMLGGDENSAKDMGIVIANADRVREATGATVMLVHHTRKDGAVERGSGALRGACDTMLAVVGDRDELVLRCEKQKDAEHFSDVRLSFEPHGFSGVVTAWQ